MNSLLKLFESVRPIWDVHARHKIVFKGWEVSVSNFKGHEDPNIFQSDFPKRAAFQSDGGCFVNTQKSTTASICVALRIVG